MCVECTREPASAASCNDVTRASKETLRSWPSEGVMPFSRIFLNLLQDRGESQLISSFEALKLHLLNSDPTSADGAMVITLQFGIASNNSENSSNDMSKATGGAAPRSDNSGPYANSERTVRALYKKIKILLSECLPPRNQTLGSQ